MNRYVAAIGSCAVWAVLAIAPAYLVSSGTIGTIDADGNISGGVFWFWVLGYLVSLAWMWVVDKAAGRSGGWFFLPTSMLPWLIDFVAAFTPRGAVVLIALIVLTAAAMAFWIVRSVEVDGFAPATATVVRVLPPFLHMNLVENGVYLHRRVVVDIPRADGFSYRATVPILTEIGNTPSAGDTIPVRVDPAHPSRVVAVSSS